MCLILEEHIKKITSNNANLSLRNGQYLFYIKVFDRLTRLFWRLFFADTDQRNYFLLYSLYYGLFTKHQTRLEN